MALALELGVTADAWEGRDTPFWHGCGLLPGFGLNLGPEAWSKRWESADVGLAALLQQNFRQQPLTKLYLFMAKDGGNFDPSCTYLWQKMGEPFLSADFKHLQPPYT